jgi:hypothetical protein
MSSPKFHSFDNEFAILKRLAKLTPNNFSTLSNESKFANINLHKKFKISHEISRNPELHIPKPELVEF